MIIRNVKLFLSALALSCKVADPKSSMHALSQVRLQNDPGVCRLVSTDLETTLISTVPTDTDTGTDCAVNAKALATMIKKLGADGPIDLEVNGAKLVIRSGKRNLGLATFPVADLPVPPVPTSRGIDFDKPAFARSLAYVESMASQDDTRPHLCVVRAEFDRDSVKLVSTDGHRLAVSSVAGRGGTDGNVGHVEILSHGASVVLDVCKATNGAAPVCRFGYLDNLSTFTCGPHTLVLKNGDRSFPPYERVIPGYHDALAQVDAEALYDALDLAKAMTQGPNFSVVLRLTSVLSVATAEPDTGSTSEDVAVTVLKDNRQFSPAGEDERGHATPAEDGSMGYNAAYLLDALKGRSGSITLGVGLSMDPMVVRYDDDPDTFCVIMPQRL